MLLLNKKKRVTEEECMDEKRRAELVKEIKEVKKAIDLAYQNFSYVVEPELIDSCIYELNASQLRYKFLLNQVKKI